MAYKINVGDKIPNFTAKDQDEQEFTSKDLIGTPTVLYFYPKDGTSGCTTEACDFRDNIPKFENLDAQVIGVSPDDAESHQEFADEHDLSFPLLCDENHKLCHLFDVLRDKNQVERTTFVIDGQGVIRWIERPVDIKGHIERVMQAVKVYD